MNSAYRITLEEAKGRLSVKHVRKLAMRAPPAHGRDEPDAMAIGRCVVLRDRNGRVLYRRTINGILSPSVEYPTGDPARPFGRVEAKRARIVSIVIPDIADARVVEVVEVPGPGRQQGKSTDGAVKLITVRLGDHDDDRHDKESGS